MKLYLASSFSIIPRVEELANALERAGHTITCKWWNRIYQTKDLGPKSTQELKKIYQNLPADEFYNRPETGKSFEADLQGISQAEALIFVADKEPKPFIGANVELGIAIGLQIPRFIYGCLANSAMYYGTKRCNTVDELLDALSTFVVK